MSKGPVIAIAGAGCAGLSLACKLILNKIPFKKLYLIDNRPHKSNDRTWCFWKKHNETLWCEPAISHRWKRMEVVFKKNTLVFDIHPLEYCHIPGSSFYEFCFSFLDGSHNVESINDDILDFISDNGRVCIKCKNQNIIADVVFNSALRLPEKEKGNIWFYQQFLGYFIKFRHGLKTDTARWMDFSVAQGGRPSFVYILPFSADEALVEYTVFTKEKMPKNWFKEKLDNYISANLHVENYEVAGEEFADIPMFSGSWLNPWGNNVHNIGISGGNVRSSTGFAFRHIQRHTDHIIYALRKNKKIKNSVIPKRFRVYDHLLLRLFDKDGNCAPDFFFDLFSKNNFIRLSEFLNNESGVWDELKLMNSVRKWFI
ncbi:MAG: lycopene cyclase family protein [Bacteroidia bacterium]|nr:lycopene cyclase family protein [Bacteroidia bacterium]